MGPNFGEDIKALTKKARKSKKSRVKGRQGDYGGGMLEGGGGSVERAPMDKGMAGREQGEIRYRKGGFTPAKGQEGEAELMQRRGETRAAGKEALEMERLRNALKRRRMLKRIMQGLE
jgi:hypothetical protein